MLNEKISVYKQSSNKSCIHCNASDAEQSSLISQSTAGNAELDLITDEMVLAAEDLLSQPPINYWPWGKGQRGRSENCKDASGLDARVTVAYHFEPDFEHPAAAAYELEFANEDGEILRLFSSSPCLFQTEVA